MNTPTQARTPDQVPRQPTVSRGEGRETPSLGDAAQDAVAVFQNYAKERPDVVAFTCLGVGFILGWKLKPW